MRALYTEGMLPITEVCELCGLTAKQARDNLGAARNDGLVVGERDDVTQRLGFKLTPDGKKWVTDRDLHLKNSKASQDADTDDATQEAVAIGEAIADTREPVVDDAPIVQATAAAEKATATLLYGTLDEAGKEFDSMATLDEAIAKAKALAAATGFNVPVYRMILVGTARTVVDFIAEEATA